MLRPCNPWDDVNRHGHISKTEGLVDTDELKSHLFLVHFSVCFSFKNE